jgi:hypothetical protein
VCFPCVDIRGLHIHAQVFLLIQLSPKELPTTVIQQLEALLKKAGPQGGFIDPGLMKGFVKGGLWVVGAALTWKEFKQNLGADIKEGFEEAKTARFVGDEALGFAGSIKGTIIGGAVGGPFAPLTAFLGVS